MKVVVRLFGVLRQQCGSESVELEVPPATTAGQLRAAVARRIPELAAVVGRSMIALNRQYAADDDDIDPAVEIACIPPVSGG